MERIVSIDPCGEGQYVHTYGDWIVRCRDCEHASDEVPCGVYCVAMDTIMPPDGFCSLGRRRDE